jgi:hypothetical protein
MAWHDEPDHPLAGVAEKLIRVKENVSNLDSEIGMFFEQSDYPVLPENDHKVLLKAIEYHKNRVVPPRFSVLAGEIIHHLRSCFDHIAWHFSVQPVKNIRKIEFPVFDQRPGNHASRKLYEGKVEGITDISVRSLIDSVQPYNASDPLSDPLWIIHELDIVDKHRELVILPSTGSFSFPPEMKAIIEDYERTNPELGPADIARHFKRYGMAHPSISLKNFGGKKIEPIIPGLTQLFNYTVVAVGKFAAL